MKPSTRVCRAQKANDPCDLADTCSGASVYCPPDSRLPVGATVYGKSRATAFHCVSPSVVRRPRPFPLVKAMALVWNAFSNVSMEMSVDAPAVTFAGIDNRLFPSRNCCVLPSQPQCVDNLCVYTQPRPSGHLCRPKAGDCDVEERCDGQRYGINHRVFFTSLFVHTALSVLLTKLRQFPFAAFKAAIVTWKKSATAFRLRVQLVRFFKSPKYSHRACFLRCCASSSLSLSTCSWSVRSRWCL